MIVKSLEHLNSLSQKVAEKLSKNDCVFLIGEIGVGKTTFARFLINYLQEKNHIGNNEYIKSKINYEIGNDKNLTYEFKRNLITNSSEFYNLSYEYFNDCLRAGLVFRREFYNDSEIEAENSLMFKVTSFEVNFDKLFFILSISLPFFPITKPGLDV